MFAKLCLGIGALVLAACTSKTPAPAARHVAAPSTPTSPDRARPKRSAQPAQDWTLTLPTGSVLRAAAIDREGDLILAPTLALEERLAAGKLARGLSLSKLKKDGSVRWSRQISTNAEAFVRAIEVTDDGHYVIAGTFAGEISIGDLHLQSQGDRDAFVAMFSQEGQLRWMRALGGLAREQATTLAISEEAQQVTIGGWAESSFRFAGKEHPARGTAKDGFIATYDLSGTPQWAQRYQGIGIDQVHALAYDRAELTVFGSFTSALRFGTEILRSKGERDMFCARYEAEGALLWHRAWGSAKRDRPVDITIADSGRISALGVIEGDIEMGAESWPSQGESDLLLWSMDASGEVELSRRLGGKGGEFATDSEPGPAFTLTGYYTGQAQLAHRTLPAPVAERAFLLQLDSDFSVLDAQDLDFDRLLFVKRRFGGQLLVGLWQGQVKIHFQEQTGIARLSGAP